MPASQLEPIPDHVCSALRQQYFKGAHCWLIAIRRHLAHSPQVCYRQAGSTALMADKNIVLWKFWNPTKSLQTKQGSVAPWLTPVQQTDSQSSSAFCRVSLEGLLWPVCPLPVLWGAWQFPEHQLWEAGTRKGWAQQRQLLSMEIPKTYIMPGKETCNVQGAHFVSLTDITWAVKCWLTLHCSSCESLEMSRARDGSAQRCQCPAGVCPEAEMQLPGGGSWKVPPSLLQQLISQTKHQQVRKNLLEICLPYFAWNCKSLFPWMLYLWKPQMNCSCWTATREWKVLN